MADSAAFLNTMVDAQARLPVDILGFCLMPNHRHIVISKSPEMTGYRRRGILASQYIEREAGVATASTRGVLL